MEKEMMRCCRKRAFCCSSSTALSLSFTCPSYTAIELLLDSACSESFRRMYARAWIAALVASPRSWYRSLNSLRYFRINGMEDNRNASFNARSR